MIKNYLLNIAKAMRVHQWLKNFLILFPLIFSGNILNAVMLVSAMEAFFIFSFIASGVYIMNDIIDIEQDRLHVIKKMRPIASGALPIWYAAILGVVLFIIGFLGAYEIFGTQMFVLVGSYFILNVFYSFSLKKIPPLDIILVAVFYLIRPIVGALAIGVLVTNWLIITTFFAALYLVILKRYAELSRISHSKIVTRKNINMYNEPFLEKISLVILSVAIVSYAIYSSNFDGFFVLTTIPLVGLALRSVLISQTSILEFENPERFIYKDSVSVSFFLIWLCMVISYHV